MADTSSRKVWIKKDIECSSPGCDVWTSTVILKNTDLKSKMFYCSAGKFKEKDTEINQLRVTLQEKVAELKSLINNKLDNLVTDFNFKPETGRSPSQASSSQHRKLNLVLVGMEEEVGEDHISRNNQLEDKVCNIANELNCTEPKNAIADCYRIGKYYEGRRRPILIKFGNIWEKRKVLAEFYKSRSERRLNYFIREDRPISEQHKRARTEAQKRNEDEKSKTNGIITKSYSGRSDGSVVKYILVNGRWKKDEIITSSKEE